MTDYYLFITVGRFLIRDLNDREMFISKLNKFIFSSLALFVRRLYCLIIY